MPLVGIAVIADAGLAQLDGRRGWQVYRDNGPALAFWSAYCRCRGPADRRYETVENRIPVVKSCFDG